MNRHGEIAGDVDDRVDQRRVRVRQLVRIVSALFGLRAQLRVAQIRQIVSSSWM